LFAVVIAYSLCVQPSHALINGFISGCMNAEVVDDGHTASLTIKQGGVSTPVANKKTWTFVCITSGANSYCTTGGTGQMDQELFGNLDQYNILKGMAQDIGGVTTGKNPTTTDDSAKLSETIKWYDVYLPAVIHQWSWVQEVEPTGGAGTAGAVGAQQQANLAFDKLSEDTKRCVPIGWDPRGYVFDVNTFFPVKNVQVELYKKNTAGTFDFVPNALGLSNPTTTNSNNGQFSFFVDNGWYNMKLKNPGMNIATLTTAQQTTANKLLTDVDGKSNIYVENVAVEEKIGTVAIAHIPVSVTDQSLLLKNLVVIDSVPPTAEGDSLRIFGRVSHPKSKMIITMNMINGAGEAKQFIKTDVTDGLGEFNKLISQTVDSEEELFFVDATVKFELNSFYTTGVYSKNIDKQNKIGIIGKIKEFFIKKIEVSAATTTDMIVVKPIPSYIDGIAYDALGKAIPKAIVGVYPFYSENPMYVTVADENGRYKIGSQHLPQVQYKLRYKKPTGEVVIVDTSTFVKQNVKLFVQEGIKPFDIRKTSAAEEKATNSKVSESVTTSDITAMAQAGKTKTTTSSRGGSSGSSQSNKNTETPIPTQNGTAGMQGIIMVVVALLVLLMIGVGAFFVMKSKQQAPPQY